DHREAGSGDLLEPPGRRRRGREAARDRVGRDAERPRGGGGTEEVLDVGRADERAGERHALTTEHEDPPRAGERRLDVARMNVATTARDPDGTPGDRAREPRPEGTFDVHHRDRIRLPPGRKMLEEEPRLRRVVALEIAVEVEVIAGQVREHGGVEATTADPV